MSFCRKRHTFILLITAFIFLNFCLPVSAAPEEITVLSFGEKVPFDVEPFINQGRVLVPARPIAEALGADVSFDSLTNVMTIQKGSYTITLPLNSSEASKVVLPKGTYIDSQISRKTLLLDVPANSYQGRIFVPVRFIAESFDIGVYWNPKTKTVNIGTYLVDSPSNPGWKIIRGHAHENEIEVLLKLDSNNVEIDNIYKDLIHNGNESVTWFDGKTQRSTSRKEVYEFLSEYYRLFTAESLNAYFGDIYEDWEYWEYLQDDGSHLYDRHLKTIDQTKYENTGINAKNTYKWAEISIDGGIDHWLNSKFAYINQTKEKIAEWCGMPNETVEMGMAGEPDEPVRYMTEAYYDEFTLYFVDNIMVGFSTDTDRWGCGRIFVGDSVDALYTEFHVDPNDWDAHKNYYGTTVITLYFKGYDVGYKLTRILEKDLASINGPYYELTYRLDSNNVITDVMLLKKNF